LIGSAASPCAATKRRRGSAPVTHFPYEQACVGQLRSQETSESVESSVSLVNVLLLLLVLVVVSEEEPGFLSPLSVWEPRAGHFSSYNKLTTTSIKV